MLFVPFFAIGMLLCHLYSVQSWVAVPISATFASVLAFVAMFMATRFAGGAGQVIARIVAPSDRVVPRRRAREALGKLKSGLSA